MVVLAGAGSLAWDLSTSLRLPSEADWAEAAAAVRADPADGVQLWPAWAEGARRYLAGPVFIEEDPLRADYVSVRQLWVLTLPRLPFVHALALEQRGATRVGEARRFGAIELQRWDLHAKEVATDLTHAAEEHEVDYLPRRCVEVRIGGRFEARGEGAALHLRAGVIGERAYDAGRPEVSVQVFADGAPLGTLEVPRTVKDGTGYRALDVPLQGPQARTFMFAVSSPDAGRPFCLQAWTTR